jgi:hypothetical protein
MTVFDATGDDVGFGHLIECLSPTVDIRLVLDNFESLLAVLQRTA